METHSARRCVKCDARLSIFQEFPVDEYPGGNGGGSAARMDVGVDTDSGKDGTGRGQNAIASGTDTTVDENTDDSQMYTPGPAQPRARSQTLTRFYPCPTCLREYDESFVRVEYKTVVGERRVRGRSSAEQ